MDMILTPTSMEVRPAWFTLARSRTRFADLDGLAEGHVVEARGDAGAAGVADRGGRGRLVDHAEDHAAEDLAEEVRVVRHRPTHGGALATREVETGLGSSEGSTGTGRARSDLVVLSWSTGGVPHWSFSLRTE